MGFWLGGSWSHRCTLFFSQSRNENPHLSLPTLSPLGICQRDGKRDAQVEFSFTIACEVGWTWVSDPAASGLDKAWQKIRA